MSEAQTERTTVVITNNKNDVEFIAKGEIIVFDGFLKVYGKMIDDTILPPLKVDQELNCNKAVSYTHLDVYKRQSQY